MSYYLINYSNLVYSYHWNNIYLDILLNVFSLHVTRRGLLWPCPSGPCVLSRGLPQPDPPLRRRLRPMPRCCAHGGTYVPAEFPRWRGREGLRSSVPVRPRQSLRRASGRSSRRGGGHSPWQWDGPPSLHPRVQPP